MIPGDLRALVMRKPRRGGSGVNIAAKEEPWWAAMRGRLSIVAASAAHRRGTMEDQQMRNALEA